MTPEEAARLAATVRDLWPNPAMGDVRLAFYANALAQIPSFEDGLRAVNALFIVERFSPTPGQVIDRALGLSDRAEREWRTLCEAAQDALGGRPVPRAISQEIAAARAVLRDLVPGGVYDLPLEDHRRLDRLHAQFVDRRVEDLRGDLNERLALAQG